MDYIVLLFEQLRKFNIQIRILPSIVFENNFNNARMSLVKLKEQFRCRSDAELLAF
jgi:hypothetical protein